MTCHDYEPLIALYVGGDLNDRDVDLHLAECAGCREVLQALRGSQAALKGLAEVDAAFLSAVRSGALAKIERRRPVWPWVAAFAMAGALILMLAIPVRAPRPSGVATLVREVPPAQTVEVAQGGVTGKRGRPGGRPRTRGSALLGSMKQKSRVQEPLVVKMLTDDPNIVIIWLVDQRGD